VSTHSIGAIAVILDDASRVLLCHRADRDMWNLPGGRVEATESPWDAVVREVNEEVGLLVRVDCLLGIYAVESRADLVFNFRGVPVGGVIRLSAEADNIQWFNHKNIPLNTLPRHRKLTMQLPVALACACKHKPKRSIRRPESCRSQRAAVGQVGTLLATLRIDGVKFQCFLRGSSAHQLPAVPRHSRPSPVTRCPNLTAK